jgi:hypothetical protein
MSGARPITPPGSLTSEEGFVTEDDRKGRCHERRAGGPEADSRETTDVIRQRRPAAEPMRDWCTDRRRPVECVFTRRMGRFAPAHGALETCDLPSGKR